MENLGFLSLAVAAFLGSLGHCVGMCGGFVLAYASTKLSSNFDAKNRFFAHLLYNLGRALSYSALGAFVGALGAVFALHPVAKAGLYLFAAAVMILTGLWLLGFLWAARLLERDFTKISFFKTAFQRLLKSNSKLSFLALGALNGFFPCGLVYFFAAAAASSGSAVNGALIMFVFGLSTFAPMLTLAYAASALQKAEFRGLASKISGAIILCFALYTAYKAVTLT